MNLLQTIDALALDDLARSDHSYLTAADRCWCLARYVSGPGYRAGRVNQLIANLKCSPTVTAVNPARRAHKRAAIDQAADVVRRAVHREWAESATWIPIPPSRAPGDKDYDDRLMRILRTAFEGYDIDVRSALFQAQSQCADHFRVQRLSLQVLYEVIRVNAATLSARSLRSQIVLFDDVLTTGKHYRCCERRLREAVTDIPIGGLFLARRALSGRARRLSGLVYESRPRRRSLMRNQQGNSGRYDP